MLDHLCSGSERSRGPKLIDYGTGRKCCPRVDRLDPAKIPCGALATTPTTGRILVILARHGSGSGASLAAKMCMLSPLSHRFYSRSIRDGCTWAVIGRAHV